MNESEVLLVGAGPMAVAYAKVLQAHGKVPVAVGRGSASAAAFREATGLAASEVGIEAWIAGGHRVPERAIVAVGERWLGAVTRRLVEAGARSLLVEKPGGFDPDDIRAVAATASARGAEVSVGYNRRFYASVEAARRLIAEDGGVSSFNFEFTEWGHVIAPLEKEEGVKAQWFLANSTHVIDLAFHLGGAPAEIACFTAGGIDWHPSATVFAGAGSTAAGALFSYQANWQAPGRWGAEILTRKRRFIFRPLEKLQVQNLGSVAIEPVNIDDTLDQRYKPGLYRQVAAFLAGDGAILPGIAEQVAMLAWYEKIRGDGRRA
ncbi:MAG: Gfo/Idh/MocA family oxidoreductase [Burkholderiales bacterium]|nr:Gfo/Idh/MocA family oxidoreductase [Burkholderiales bacterium]